MGRFEEVTIGELKDGDRILGSDGEIVTVEKAYDHHVPDKMYEIENDAGQILRVSGNHLMYVESSIDLDYHPTRLKKAKKELKKYSDEKMNEIRDYIESYESGDHDVSLHEMVMFMDAQSNQDMIDLLHRIASSIGPVAEENYVVQDLYDEQDVDGVGNFIQKYDKRAFFRQLLALSPRKKSDKSIPVIVGRVITAEKMFEEMEYSEVSIPDSPTLSED